jgi:hypothetical protein
MQECMKSPGCKAGLAATTLFATVLGCGETQRPAPVTSPAVMPLPERTVSTSSSSLSSLSSSGEPRPPTVSVDPRRCDPAGKAIVVVGRDADGRPNRWHYFAFEHHAHQKVRVMTCEAADSNGDGKVDTRYFYASNGKLILEQRDLDFDGHAEFVADYSQFSKRRLLVHARDVQ